jgi:hypothetical protein
MMSSKQGITSSKALEILALNLKEASRHIPPDVKLSLALACECFKHYHRMRLYGVIPSNFLLPGELPCPNGLPFSNDNLPGETEHP